MQGNLDNHRIRVHWKPGKATHELLPVTPFCLQLRHTYLTPKCEYSPEKMTVIGVTGVPARHNNFICPKLLSVSCKKDGVAKVQPQAGAYPKGPRTQILGL